MKNANKIPSGFKEKAETWLHGEAPASAFDALVAEYGAEMVAAGLVKAFGTEETFRLAKKANGARLFAPCTREIKTVAFFYYRYYNG